MVTDVQNLKVGFEFCPELCVSRHVASKEPVCMEDREINGRYISEKLVVRVGTSLE